MGIEPRFCFVQVYVRTMVLFSTRTYPRIEYLLPLRRYKWLTWRPIVQRRMTVYQANSGPASPGTPRTPHSMRSTTPWNTVEVSWFGFYLHYYKTAITEVWMVPWTNHCENVMDSETSVLWSLIREVCFVTARKVMWQVQLPPCHSEMSCTRRRGSTVNLPYLV